MVKIKIVRDYIGRNRFLDGPALLVQIESEISSVPVEGLKNLTEQVDLPQLQVSGEVSVLETFIAVASALNRLVCLQPLRINTVVDAAQESSLVLCEYRVQPVGLAVIQTAATLIQLALVDTAAADQSTRMRRAMAVLSQKAESILPRSMQALLAQAERRNLPWSLLEKTNFYQLGHAATSVLINPQYCALPSAVSLQLLADKEWLSNMLASSGIPVVRLSEDKPLYIAQVIGNQLWIAKRQDDGQTAVLVDQAASQKTAELLLRATALLRLDVATVLFSAVQTSTEIDLTAIADISVKPVPVFYDDNQETDRALFEAIATKHALARLPTIAVTGTSGKTTTCAMLRSILSSAGLSVGMTSTEGAWLNNTEIIKGDVAGGRAARKILKDPQIDVAILETSRGGILTTGLGFDQCDVGVVLNIGDDHVGTDGVNSRQEMATVKGLVAQASSRALVINADDSLCLTMVEGTSLEVCLFSEQPDNPALKLHQNNGGRSCVIHHDQPGAPIIYCQGQVAVTVIESDQIPATLNGSLPHKASNALAATAAAIMLGVEIAAVNEGLLGFASTVGSTPGRMNIYNHLGFKVVVDFAAAPESLAALSQWAQSQPVTGKRIGVISAPGNRPDVFFAETAAAAADCFDHYICAPFSSDLRGRGLLEVQELIKAGLLAKGVDSAAISVVESVNAGVKLALSMASKSDLVAIATKDHQTARQIMTTQAA